MIPSFLGISFVVFFISTQVPGDPVQLILDRQNSTNTAELNKGVIDKKIAFIRREFNFNKPLFYFKLTDASQSDTLYKISDRVFRDNLSSLSFEHGNWEVINSYVTSLNKVISVAYTTEQPEFKSRLLQLTSKLKSTNSTKGLIDQLLFFKLGKTKEIQAEQALEELESIILKMASSQTRANRFIPKFIWYGTNNQYHNWISGFLSGDFGVSYVDKSPVLEKIINAIGWTLLLSTISIIISYLLAIPMGVYLAMYKDSFLAKLITQLLFLLHCIPSFWLASLLIIFLASPEYFQWFPSYGLGNFEKSSSWWSSVSTVVPHLFLPLICFSYSSLAYISEQTKRSVIQIKSENYIQTAQAKGLKRITIYWKHILKNTSFTLITQLGNLIPSMISGSFVVEYIFAIPGMGKLLVDSINLRDYPTVFSIVMISAILVMLGILISEILYAKFDPRVKPIESKRT